MNYDIASLAGWVTHWLVLDHYNLPVHEPYINIPKVEIVRCLRRGDDQKYAEFLDSVDGVIYVEHPCIEGDFDIVLQARARGKLVVGIPMWEWWPSAESWMLNTDVLWAVNPFTRRYLQSFSEMLSAAGISHNWRARIYGERWGVNLDEFEPRVREYARSFVFVNGNGGFKGRKALDLVLEAFSMSGAPKLTIHSQIALSRERVSKNIEVVEENYPHRQSVYSSGDIFIFPSYWEGLCHGLYEGQAVGGVVITTDYPPMNECGTPFLLPVKEVSSESLNGKMVAKARCSPRDVFALCSTMAELDITAQSLASIERIRSGFDLKVTLRRLLFCITENLCSR